MNQKIEDIEVDICLICNVVWLDEGELERLKATSEDGFEHDKITKI